MLWLNQTFKQLQNVVRVFSLFLAAIGRSRSCVVVKHTHTHRQIERLKRWKQYHISRWLCIFTRFPLSFKTDFTILLEVLCLWIRFFFWCLFFVIHVSFLKPLVTSKCYNHWFVFQGDWTFSALSFGTLPEQLGSPTLQGLLNHFLKITLLTCFLFD